MGSVGLPACKQVATPLFTKSFTDLGCEIAFNKGMVEAFSDVWFKISTALV